MTLHFISYLEITENKVIWGSFWTTNIAIYLLVEVLVCFCWFLNFYIIALLFFYFDLIKSKCFIWVYAMVVLESFDEPAKSLLIVVERIYIKRFMEVQYI